MISACLVIQLPIYGRYASDGSSEMSWNRSNGSLWFKEQIHWSVIFFEIIH